ncbi:uncharacterized protein LOC129409905 [Boleophthalmus pectinirostris]|uniref:uncharacterized protein LOC129409905 n=1 Tax=Boleophthalmus pectinirostris TaxID=150288 RepID=UPI002430726E|nr:uncharacterized protein LOC129409905 [Boleophthalmus pectinirostris]
MKISLLFVLFGLSGAQGPVFTATEGGTVTVKCPFSTSGNKKTLCKNVCNQTADFLIQTTGNRRNKGRYSIKYEKRSSAAYLLKVSIKKVKRSDAGEYRCVLEKNGHVLELYKFNLRVRDSFFTPAPSLSPPGYQQTAPLSGVVLYTGLCLTAVIVLSVTLFIWCRIKRVNQTRESPESPEYAQVAESGRVYEEIPADRAETGDLSSAVTHPQVDLPKCSSAPRCPTPRTEEVPLYSTVCLPQQ